MRACRRRRRATPSWSGPGSPAGSRRGSRRARRGTRPTRSASVKRSPGWLPPVTTTSGARPSVPQLDDVVEARLQLRRRAAVVLGGAHHHDRVDRPGLVAVADAPHLEQRDAVVADQRRPTSASDDAQPASAPTGSRGHGAVSATSRVGIGSPGSIAGAVEASPARRRGSIAAGSITERPAVTTLADIASLSSRDGAPSAAIASSAARRRRSVSSRPSSTERLEQRRADRAAGDGDSHRCLGLAELQAVRSPIASQRLLQRVALPRRPSRSAAMTSARMCSGVGAAHHLGERGVVDRRVGEEQEVDVAGHLVQRPTRSARAAPSPRTPTGLNRSRWPWHIVGGEERRAQRR